MISKTDKLDTVLLIAACILLAPAVTWICCAAAILWD